MTDRTNGRADGGAVEVDPLPDGGVTIRDGANAQVGPVLSFTREEWDAFVAGVKNGEFDPGSHVVPSPDR